MRKRERDGSVREDFGSKGPEIRYTYWSEDFRSMVRERLGKELGAGLG